MDLHEQKWPQGQSNDGFNKLPVLLIYSDYLSTFVSYSSGVELTCLGCQNCQNFEVVKFVTIDKPEIFLY